MNVHKVGHFLMPSHSEAVPPVSDILEDEGILDYIRRNIM